MYGAKGSNNIRAWVANKQAAGLYIDAMTAVPGLRDPWRSARRAVRRYPTTAALETTRLLMAVIISSCTSRGFDRRGDVFGSMSSRRRRAVDLTALLQTVLAARLEFFEWSVADQSRGGFTAKGNPGERDLVLRKGNNLLSVLESVVCRRPASQEWTNADVASHFQRLFAYSGYLTAVAPNGFKGMVVPSTRSAQRRRSPPCRRRHRASGRPTRIARPRIRSSSARVGFSRKCAAAARFCTSSRANRGHRVVLAPPGRGYQRAELNVREGAKPQYDYDHYERGSWQRARTRISFAISVKSRSGSERCDRLG
jgi:hypothetical protein